MKRYRRTKEFRRREMERLLHRLEEYSQTPEGANDQETAMLLNAVKKHLDQKAQRITRTASQDDQG